MRAPAIPLEGARVAESAKAAAFTDRTLRGTARRTTALANGRAHALRNGILFSVPPEWRPILEPMLDALERPVELGVVLAVIQLSWHQGYAQGYRDAILGRHYQPGPRDN